MNAVSKLLLILVLSIALPASSPSVDPDLPLPATNDLKPILNHWSASRAAHETPQIENVALMSSPPYAKNDYKWRQREYVYGPGYVDEFVGILDEQRALVFLLQDGNHNVTAVVNGIGALLEQYQYEPYGKVVRRTPLSGLTRPFLLRIGHQGLFFDRFDYVPGTARVVSERVENVGGP